MSFKNFMCNIMSFKIKRHNITRAISWWHLQKNAHGRANRERFSTSHTTQDLQKIDVLELEDKNPRSMIQDPPNIRTFRFYHEPESLDSSHAGLTATTFQSTTSIITEQGLYQIEGAQWHLLTQVFSDPTHFQMDQQGEMSVQESLDNDPRYIFFSWQILRRAVELCEAKTDVFETGFTTPSFCPNARRGTKAIWGSIDDSPIVVNWSVLSELERTDHLKITHVFICRHWGTCTQQVKNIMSLEEQSRDSTIEMFWGNNKLACPLNYLLVRWERHEKRDGCGRMHEYVT